MSRYIESLPSGKVREVCASEEDCRYKINGICCSDKSETRWACMTTEWCGTVCPYFEPEDMKEGEIRYE